MRTSHQEQLVISGAPLIGEGNVVDCRALVRYLAHAGLPGVELYPNGPFVFLGRRYHMKMTTSIRRAMDYIHKSERERSSLKVLPLRWELRLELTKAFKAFPHATCFITSQSIMAEESVKAAHNVPTVLVSSDVSGKLSADSRISERQNEIVHLVWNKEALDLYVNGLSLKHVYLVLPVDPLYAFKHRERSQLPLQEALDEPNLCLLKLSGSGGDCRLVNEAITSLWENSRVKTVVFPGTQRTQRKIIRMVGRDVRVESSLDAAIFYTHTRESILNEQMILTFPSEQVKHMAVLAQNSIFPKVAWLPPRGKHEVNNLVWAIKHGFSGTVCIPAEYHRQMRSVLEGMNVRRSEIELVQPESLCAEHFRPSPQWQTDPGSLSLVHIVNNMMNGD